MQIIDKNMLLKLINQIGPFDIGFEPPDADKALDGRLTIARLDGKGQDFYGFQKISDQCYQIRYQGSIDDTTHPESTPETEGRILQLLESLKV